MPLQAPQTCDLRCHDNIAEWHDVEEYGRGIYMQPRSTYMKPNIEMHIHESVSNVNGLKSCVPQLSNHRCQPCLPYQARRGWPHRGLGGGFHSILLTVFDCSGGYFSVGLLLGGSGLTVVDTMVIRPFRWCQLHGPPVEL